MRKITLYSLLALILNVVSVAKAQSCSVCVNQATNDTTIIKINTRDSTTYIINAGKTLCILEGGYFTGTVTLSGGTICNNGTFQPKVMSFTSGSFTNKNNSRLPALSIGTNRNVINNNKSILAISGNFILSGGSVVNLGVLNIDGNVQNNSGSFLNKGIINCQQFTGTNSITDTGIINTD